MIGKPAAMRERPSSGAGFAWVILTVVLLASVAGSLNQFKPPPLIPVLTDAFRIDLGQAGLLMSGFALAGLVLALPAGVILQRLGPKLAGSIALAFLVIGSSWGALSTSAASLVASRVIEGVGFGLIAVVGPAAVALWFPLEKRGVPMGIWATWVPVGSVVMLNLAPAVETAWNWQAVWGPPPHFRSPPLSSTGWSCGCLPRRPASLGSPGLAPARRQA